tara:strand:+ start:127 stop:321 length:195 start_codon:yes stop_codon:yes gene_type:complete
MERLVGKWIPTNSVPSGVCGRQGLGDAIEIEVFLKIFPANISIASVVGQVDILDITGTVLLMHT